MMVGKSINNEVKSSKVLLKNQLYIYSDPSNNSYKEIRKYDTRHKSGFDTLGLILDNVYKVKNEKNEFVSVDYETFIDYLNSNGYKKPVGTWSNENHIYSIQDYENGVVRDGETLSIVLNHLYSKLGLELVVLDLDLKSNKKEDRDVIDNLMFSLSNDRDILKTPNGYHIILKRSEYEDLLSRFGLSDNDIKTTSNKLTICDIDVQVDIFRTWKDTRYILIPTKNSIREFLGGGILRNGDLIKGNTPVDIINTFINVSNDQSDSFYKSFSGNVLCINNADEMESVNKEFRKAFSSNKENALLSLCKDLGIKNLSEYNIDVLCRNISNVGDVDGTGRYDKILRYIYYYVLVKLVSKTESYDDLKSRYHEIEIYENDDADKVYNALESVYTNPRDLLVKVDLFIKRINYHRNNIALKVYDVVYKAIKKHMSRTSNSFDIVFSDRFAIGKDWDTDYLASIMAQRGVRRFDNENIVDGFLYYSVEEFKKINKHTVRAIPDSLVGFHTSKFMPRLGYEYKGKTYTEFKLIPRGVFYYYDSDNKDHLMFFRNDKTEIICLKFGESGIYMENLSKINKPIFNRYLLSANDYERMKMALPKVNVKVIKKLLEDKDKSKEFIEAFINKVFGYYSFDLSNDKIDKITKHALLASVLSDAGFIIQLVGASGTGKSVLATGLSYLGSFTNHVGTITINDNVDEVWYKILENHAQGNVVMIDEIPKDIKSQLQTLILSLVTSKSHKFRFKYSRNAIDINLPVKILTTSTQPTSWVSDAVRRSMVLYVYRASGKDNESIINDVEKYYDMILQYKVYIRVAYYSLISTVKEKGSDYTDIAQSTNIPDDLKNVFYRYFKALGYDIKDVLSAFREVNRSQDSLQTILEGLLDILSDDRFRSLLDKNPSLFRKSGNSYYISYQDFLRILYSFGMIKNETTEDYFYFTGAQNATDSIPEPNPNDYEEAFRKLVEDNDVLSNKINKRIEDLKKSRGFTKKMDELFGVYINYKMERGIKILEKKKINRKTYLFIEYFDNDVQPPTPHLQPSSSTDDSSEENPFIV